MDTIKDVLHISSKQGDARPKAPSELALKELQDLYEKAGQGQVFAFYDRLSTTEKATLYSQLSSFDPSNINDITAKAFQPPKGDDEDSEIKLEPLPDSAAASVLDSKDEEIESWYSSGLDLVAQGKVAVVLMAGGQGTRLGSSDPKGCFNIGLPSGKSLFQIQAERIRKVQQLAEKKHEKIGVVVPWYVMTSGPTRKPTEEFFQQHKYFGLGKDDVIIFEQGVLPCISNDGKILLESKSKVRIAATIIVRDNS
jgi:UDP-N-acetylglucosamine/UDP-N-acetylgalactosamine diphosphorylase